MFTINFILVQSFINHVKGKAHLNMIDRQEEQYKAHTEKLRHQMKVHSFVLPYFSSKLKPTCYDLL